MPVISDRHITAYLLEMWNWQEQRAFVNEYASEHHIAVGEVGVRVGDTTHYFTFSEFFDRLGITPAADCREKPAERAFWQDALEKDDNERLLRENAMLREWLRLIARDDGIATWADAKVAAKKALGELD